MIVRDMLWYMSSKQKYYHDYHGVLETKDSTYDIPIDQTQVLIEHMTMSCDKRGEKRIPNLKVSETVKQIYFLETDFDFLDESAIYFYEHKVLPRFVSTANGMANGHLASFSNEDVDEAFEAVLDT